MSKKYALAYPAEKILRARERGRFEAFTIWGPPREGKSSYGIKTMRDIYMALDGCDIDAAYEKALECVKFEKKDVFGTIRKYMISDEVLPVLMWDDMGVHGSSYQFFLNSKEVAALKGSFDTIGTAMSGLLMTTPTPEGVLKFVRDYHYPEIHISRMNGAWERKAQPREYYCSRRGWKLRRTDVYDQFSCYLPKWVWEKYISRRKSIAIKAIDDVMKAIEKQTNGSLGEDTKLDQVGELKDMKSRLETAS